MAASYTDRDFKLVTPYRVETFSPGDDVTLRCHLSPETRAVAMEIRWFKGTDCIYLYENGHVTVREGYEGRVRMNTQELQRGDASLTLRRSRGEDEERWGDAGPYTCQVISAGHETEARVGLWLRGELGFFGDITGLLSDWCLGISEITAEERKRMEASVQSLVGEDIIITSKRLEGEFNREMEEKDKATERQKHKVCQSDWQLQDSVRVQRQRTGGIIQWALLGAVVVILLSMWLTSSAPEMGRREMGNVERRSRELERQLKEERKKRREIEMEIERLKEETKKERKEMGERHREEMEKMRKSCEMEARAEADTNLINIILPELKRNISISKDKMEEDFIRQMEEKNREIERLKEEFEKGKKKIGERHEKEVERQRNLKTTTEKECKRQIDEKNREMERMRRVLQHIESESEGIRQAMQRLSASLLSLRSLEEQPQTEELRGTAPDRRAQRNSPRLKSSEEQAPD